MMLYLKLLMESHLYLIGLILIIYTYELITGKLILVHWFLFKKDLKSAYGSAIIESILYFFFNIGFGVYKAFIKKNVSEDFSFFIWFVIILCLSIIVGRLYYKYQGIDPDKPDYGGMLD